MKRTFFPGLRFGKLILLKEVSKSPYKWLCLCDCKKNTVVQREDLTAGRTKSCGCLIRETNVRVHTTHGLTGTSEYRAWMNMKRRCYDASNEHFDSYGGRGISVCARWRSSFQNFLSDLGKKPSPTHELDRIEVNGHYEPSNVKWSTRKDSKNNKRNTVRLSLGGNKHTMLEWSKILGVSYTTLRQRRAYGWSDEKILTSPVDTKCRHKRRAR